MVRVPHQVPAATAVLTGFIILADWLGSDEAFFHCEPQLTLDEYLPLSRARACAAVEQAGFLGSRPAPEWPGFTPLFPAIREPRPLQQAIDHLPDDAVAGPGLFIIEAPTGEGKTEAALALARRISASTGCDELYVALPTMATSNQMFTRVYDYLQRTLGEASAVKLVHGQAFLIEDDLRAQIRGDVRDPESPAAAVPTWFAPRKRALLAPWGVGTVDQAELTVLNARHYMLRLLGLAGKVVIIDEVHAYDTYMSTVIDHALWWLAALGSPVILLSATLPIARHRELAAAYRRGLLDATWSIDTEADLPYPLLAYYVLGGVKRVPLAAAANRRLGLRFIAERTPDEEAERLLALVEHGGVICRITNTVRRAQAIYRAVRARAATDEMLQIRLLHARMPGNERLARERAVAAEVGPDRERTESDRIIVVGTQVLEQSLDLDFDLLLSDLAPVDLLLQRAGRLHRHPTRAWRPPGMATPVLEVVVARDGSGLPDPGSSRFVYETALLWKTWLTLTARPLTGDVVTLTLPDDYRPLIEATYDGQPDAGQLDLDDQGRLARALEQAARGRTEARARARTRLVPDPEPDIPISEGRGITFEEDEEGGARGWGMASTRDGDPSVTITPLYQVPVGLALSPDGAPLEGTPVRETQLDILRRSFRVTNRTIVGAADSLIRTVPEWWSEVPLLRNVVPLVLDESGVACHVTTPVRLDSELGLLIGEEALI